MRPSRPGAGLLIALSLLLLGGRADGALYLTPSQAEEQLLPPHDTVRKEVMVPTADDRAWLRGQLGYAPARTRYIWRVAEHDGRAIGYLLIDNQLGKHEPITFAVALDATGRVSDVAILVYREPRGDEVRRASFLRQFAGRAFGEPLRLDKEIVHVSGATISSRSTVHVVRRALALWQRRYGNGTAGE